MGNKIWSPSHLRSVELGAGELQVTRAAPVKPPWYITKLNQLLEEANKIGLPGTGGEFKILGKSQSEFWLKEKRKEIGSKTVFFRVLEAALSEFLGYLGTNKELRRVF